MFNHTRPFLSIRPHSPFPMKYVPFKEASEVSEAKSFISYIPLTKVELWTEKIFPK